MADLRCHNLTWLCAVFVSSLDHLFAVDFSVSDVFRFNALRSIAALG